MTLHSDGGKPAHRATGHASPARNASTALLAAALLAAVGACTSAPADGDAIVMTQHQVPHRSSAPANDGAEVRLAVREKRRAIGAPVRGAVLLVHGGIVPSAPAFDLAIGDYSWMDALARAGFAVYALDHTGYGRSPQPAMDDPCALSDADRAKLRVGVLPATCPPRAQRTVSTRESDWSELETVVEFIRAREGVERVSLLGWSLGGPRAGGFAARHPERVERLVLYSPAYHPQGAGTPTPPPHPVRLVSYEAVTHGRWAARIGCPQQVEDGVRETLVATLRTEDPLGASWGDGEGFLRLRGGQQQVTGAIAWDRRGAARITAPTLILTGVEDNPARKHLLYEQLVGSDDRVIATLRCATHYALWERTGHRRLHDASIEWLGQGTFQGARRGRFDVDEDGVATPVRAAASTRD